jgi:uncharacterized pyridoxamine 5'-phosphate oxidase family protein
MAVTEEKIKKYLKMNRTIILSTIDTDGVPDIRTLGGYGISDYIIYFSTLKTSNKVKQIEGKNDVAVFIQHENQFISKFFNVTIYGKAILIENDSEYESGKTLILSRKPSLKIHKETHNIYKVIPNKIKVLDFSEQNLNERISIIKL